MPFFLCGTILKKNNNNLTFFLTFFAQQKKMLKPKLICIISHFFLDLHFERLHLKSNHLTMKTLDIIIPLYKSQYSLEALIARFNEWHQQSPQFSKRIIFVEDGGDDGTYAFLQSIKHTIQLEKSIIRLAKNYGQHTAIATGLTHSKADLVVVMDDDLQHDPFDITKLIEQLESSNADLVYAQYSIKEHHFLRNVSSKLLKLATKSKTADFSMVSSFKVMRKHVLSTLKAQQSPIILVDVYLLDSASKVETCEVTHHKRAIGKSSYSTRKLITMTLNIILFHSSWPLKMITRFGTLMSFIFFILSCYYIYQKIFHDVEMGFTSIVVAIFLSTGLILISLGIIGEYIRKIWIHQHQLEKVIIAEKEEI